MRRSMQLLIGEWAWFQARLTAALVGLHSEVSRPSGGSWTHSTCTLTQLVYRPAASSLALGLLSGLPHRE